MLTLKNILVGCVAVLVVLSIMETYGRLYDPESIFRPSIASTKLLEVLLPWAKYLGNKLAIITDIARFLKDFVYDFYVVCWSIFKLITEPSVAFIEAYASYFASLYQANMVFAIALSVGLIHAVGILLCWVYWYNIRVYFGYVPNQ
jgi:hypothetical protein